MFVRKSLSCLALLSAICAPAFGADGDGKFAVRGIGGQSCAVWIAISENADEAARRDGIMSFQSWIAGYLSAANRLKAESYDVVPFLDMINVLAITLNECRATPDQLAETVVARVVDAFTDARVVSESPTVTVIDAGVEKTYRQATIALAQQRLVDLGYLEGEPDGVLGPASFEALTQYQADNGLPASGEMSVDTLFKLLLTQQ